MFVIVTKTKLTRSYNILKSLGTFKLENRDKIRSRRPKGLKFFKQHTFLSHRKFVVTVTSPINFSQSRPDVASNADATVYCKYKKYPALIIGTNAVSHYRSLYYNDLRPTFV